MSKFVPTIIGVLLLAGAGYALYVWRTQELVPVAMVPAPTRPAPVPAPPPVVQEEPPVQEKIIDPPAAAAGTLDRNAALDLWAQKIVDEEGTGTDAAAALQRRRDRFQQHPVDSAVLNRFTIYLDRWKALLDPEVARHLQFASIDCRFMICEILAVENAVRVSEAGSVRTPLLPADLTTLDQTEWWKNEKFALAFYEATPFKGYQLITLYIHYPDHP